MTGKITVKNFSKRLSLFTTNRKALDKEANALARFCIGHVHEHGDAIYLNEFWKVMGKSYQGQFRRFVISSCANDADDLASSWLTMVKGEWAINPDFKGEVRNLYSRVRGEPEVQVKSADELPDFTEIDVDTVKNPFADDNIVSGLKRMSKSAHGDDAKVSEEMAKLVDDALVKATKLHEMHQNKTASAEGTTTVQ